MSKRKLSRLLSVALAISLCLALSPVTALAADELGGKTVILASANLRGNIDVLPRLTTLKHAYESKGADVLLADTGNFLQGTVYAAYDSGQTVIGLMDTAGYDVVAIGSHEFDFGTGQVGVEQHEVYYADDTLGKLLADASLRAVSANILTGGETINAFAPAAVVTTKSGRTIGFFGLTDPNTPNRVLETNIAGLTFTDSAQAAAEQVSALHACDLVVGLSNAGTKASVEGAVMLDAHTDEGLTVTAVIIDNESGVVETTEAVKLSETAEDAAVKAAVDAAKAVVSAEYPASAIVKSEVTLNGSLAANRSGETNTGDLWTDALLWFATEGGIADYYDEDEIANGNTGIQVEASHVVAVWNGGNLRDYLHTGDVTMKDIQRVLPYPNRVAVVYLTGAQLLEMLEASAQGLPYTDGTSAVCAAFLQTAGLRYTVKTGAAYDAGEAYGNNWFKANTIRRVTIDSVNDAAFDPAATYAVITSNAIANGMDSNYICLAKDADLSTITTAAVTDVVWLYINRKLGGVIGPAYASPQNRITIDATVSYADVPVSAAYYDDVVYAVQNGLMRGTDGQSFEPDAGMTRADFITMLYTLAGSPQADATGLPFADVADDAPYAKAVAWAYANEITAGTSASAFSPLISVNREQMSAFIYHYYQKPAAGADMTFTDAGSISAWAVPAVLFCTDHGYMNAADAAFQPKRTATRAEAAAALARMHKK